MQKGRIDNKLDGTSLNTRETKYRSNIFTTALYANILMGQVDIFKTFLYLKGPHNLTLGSAKDIPQSVGSAVMSKNKGKFGI